MTPWRWTATPADFQHPFLLQVSSYDRVGVLHGAHNRLAARQLLHYHSGYDELSAFEVLSALQESERS